ncbi:hypothetical protein, partial [uncultured Porphyromonas sp.]|uniref:hypothetical protein n=1 Tax=uncultured Porphyromonas sp. TaxID=159274 RepID=UPI002606E4F5
TLIRRPVGTHGLCVRRSTARRAVRPYKDYLYQIHSDTSDSLRFTPIHSDHSDHSDPLHYAAIP